MSQAHPSERGVYLAFLTFPCNLSTIWYSSFPCPTLLWDVAMLWHVLRPSNKWSSSCSHSQKGIPDNHTPKLDAMRRNTGSGGTVKRIFLITFRCTYEFEKQCPAVCSAQNSHSLGESNVIESPARTGVIRVLGHSRSTVHMRLQKTSRRGGQNTLPGPDQGL